MFLRYCIGVMPNCCLKALEKCDGFWKPHLVAMVARDELSLEIKRRA